MRLGCLVLAVLMSVSLAMSETASAQAQAPAFAPAPASAFAPTPAPEVQASTSSLRYHPGRPFLELLFAVGAMGVGGLAGGLLGAACMPPPTSEWGCLGPILDGIYSGALVGFPVGVYLAGDLLEGRGDLALTVALPWAFAALNIVSAFTNAALIYDAAPLMLGGGALAATSSVVIYELSSYANSRPPKPDQAWHVSGYAHRQGAGLSLSGRL